MYKKTMPSSVTVCNLASPDINEDVWVLIMQRLTDIQSRLTSLERQVVQDTLGKDTMKNKLAYELVDSVSAVVGLREMVTWKRRSMKFIWAMLFFVGVLATGYYIYSSTEEYLAKPTATNVELRRSPQYDYPYLALCPGAWVDTPKALSKGLTKEALKYSIGYLDVFAWDQTLNVTSAREELYAFYEQQNYSSLLEYFTDISMDVRAASSYEDLATLPSSAYYCVGCDDTNHLEKVILGQSALMCYAFAFKPANGVHFRLWQASPTVLLQIKDETQGVYPTSSNWRAYLLSDKRVLQPNFPFIAVEPFAVNTLKTSAQRFITLSNDNDATCLEPEKVQPGYSAEQCVMKCLHKAFTKTIKCGVFSYSAYDDVEPPSHYCNYFEMLPDTNSSFADFINYNLSVLAESAQGSACMKKCLYPCERTIYTSTLDSKYQIVLDSVNFTGNARAQNMSAIVIDLDNTALSQGGILTLAEVSTYSFSTLVSNVGGTLGLFVGGTVLTVFQVILWFIDQLLEARERRLEKTRVRVT